MLIDQRYGPPIPEGLTRMPEKQTLYSADPYFWEGWEDAVEVAGPAVLALLLSHSLILVRPDAVAARKVEVILRWLPENGLSLVACVPMAVDRHQVRALWRYQWNSARRERKDACDILMGACPSLLLVVRTAADEGEPATRRFARRKGFADPGLRRPGDLRALLGHKSRMLSFIHSPDEPADLVREIALLLPEVERKALFARMLAGEEFPAGGALKAAADLYARVPEHSLDLAESVQRVEAAAHAQMDAREPDLHEVVRLCKQIHAGTRTDWRELFAALDRHGTKYEAWDRIAIAGHIITMDFADVRVLVPRTPLDTWATNAALMGAFDHSETTNAPSR